jgi:hypothetical protein
MKSLSGRRILRGCTLDEAPRLRSLQDIERVVAEGEGTTFSASKRSRLQVYIDGVYIDATQLYRGPERLTKPLGAGYFISQAKIGTVRIAWSGLDNTYHALFGHEIARSPRRLGEPVSHEDPPGKPRQEEQVPKYIALVPFRAILGLVLGALMTTVGFTVALTTEWGFPEAITLIASGMVLGASSLGFLILLQKSAARKEDPSSPQADKEQ